MKIMSMLHSTLNEVVQFQNENLGVFKVYVASVEKVVENKENALYKRRNDK